MTWIEDRLQIEDVINTYSYLMDTDRCTRVPEEVFAEDGVLNWGFRSWTGRAALHEWFDAPRVGLRTSHNVSNVQVKVDGDDALAIHRIVGWHWFDTPGHDPDPRQQADVVLVGGYEDKFHRCPEGWRVTYRRPHVFGPGGVGIATSLPPMVARLVDAGAFALPELWER